MRKRFTQQLSIGILAIEKTEISVKLKDPLTELLAALLEIYKSPKYNEKIFSILEGHLLKGKKKTGRNGMTLWQLFVLAQVRLCENIGYTQLHALANNHLTLRSLLGMGADHGGFTRLELEYQNIYDNVSLLTDEVLQEINQVILDFGHKEVFKKKEKEALRLKSDSFVVESNVHFPTDYNLLWDCARKCLDAISKFTEKYEGLEGWRKLANWRHDLKGLMRELGKASSSGGTGKEDRVKTAAKRYIKKALALIKKLEGALPSLPISDAGDLSTAITLEHFMPLMEKHIDLVERRILKDEKIPHEEKLFSIFETYTEWVKKGKSRPNVELGKKLSITTDQYNLIIDYQIMDDEQDRDILIEIADRVLQKYIVNVWSFDKGFWDKENKELLQTQVDIVVMPKLGKRNKAEEEEERGGKFKKYKNQHSTIESNINELEHRGLDRCPDKGILNYKRYISLAVCAYNLKKIGKFILDKKREEEKAKRLKYKHVA
jgi:transposase, IS5 family